MYWWQDYFAPHFPIKMNKAIPILIEDALVKKLAHLSSEGAVVVETGHFTGRAADDKYVVEDPYSQKRIDWQNNIAALSPTQFQQIKKWVIHHLSSHYLELYGNERSVGADPEFALGIRLITPSPTHALFAQHLFRDPLPLPRLGHFTIFHAPNPDIDNTAFGLKSSTAVIINFSSKEILILGTSYAGEIKKAVFSVMNTLLPDYGILPMHAGANIDDKETVSLFFGLSGTGKTTLSTDLGKYLIGDDEHGLSPEGVFNFEGGCYAKTLGLSAKTEPQIYQAVNRFGSLLENVKIDTLSHTPMFFDKTMTENGRASYPLSAIEGALESGRAPIPRHIFFLSADAFGVLPAVSRLNSEQAISYFLHGYTAKLAGTELGLFGVKATFSHCFGAPFMMRPPKVYAHLLHQFIQHHQIKVWLINTGWSGGAYGEGKRFDLLTTRSIIRSIQNDSLEQTHFVSGPFAGLMIPESIEGVESSLLNPLKSWPSEEKYQIAATQLQLLFEANEKKILGTK